MQLSEKHKILFVTNSIGYGGAEKMMNFVCSALAAESWEVTILNLNTVSEDISTLKQKFPAGVNVVSLTEVKGNRHLAAVRQIVKLIKEKGAEAVIAFTMFPNFYAKIASLITGVPSIMSERGDPGRTITRSFKDRLMLWFINRSKGAVFQTPQAGAFYSKGLQRRGTVIPNPIFLSKAASVAEHTQREKTIVSVGRFQNIQKRIDVMLKAFQIFSAKHPEYILKMYGSGEDEYVAELCRELGIADKVKLMGSVSDPSSKICNDGMFVITSDYEGIPNALLEAMAVGLPVVSTDCTPGGARMLIQDGVNGLLVPCGNPQAVADALGKYADDSDFAEACGANARNVLVDYAPDRISRLWINYISSII